MPSRRILLDLVQRSPTVWLVAALLAAAVAACSEAGSSGSGNAPGEGVYITAAWQTARTVIGHQVHVVREKIACVKCHELTNDSIGAAVPGRCAACHEKQARIEHAASQGEERFGPGTKADCTNCHAFTPSRSGDATAGAVVPEATECSRCHTQHQGKTPGVRVHSASDCVKCHRPHDDTKPEPAACNGCHADVKRSHAAHGKSITAGCTTCHEHQHAPASDARGTCAACHSKEEPVIAATALFADGHPECLGCHRPHDFEKAEAVRCRSCHEDVLVLGAPRVREHNTCTNCHAPHDVRGSPDRACAGCHTYQQPDHPKHGAAGTCVGCHDPHPSSARAHTRARNCSSCHQAAASDKGFHGGTECKQCHQPHDFVRPASDHSACQACHAKELTLVRSITGHQACEGCHAGLPHRPTALAVGCESCHADEHKEATRGHSKCTSCHEPHGGAAATPCQSCHQGEHKSAPRGHQDCQSCHQAHSGSAAKATCASCHAPESRTNHGEMAQGCNACHRAHGPGGMPQPPACATCHATAALPSLHQVKAHQRCASCHTGHGEAVPTAERAGCLACHADRRDHFPDASSCASCHPFSKTR
jgi:hypothetical protein